MDANHTILKFPGALLCHRNQECRFLFIKSVKKPITKTGSLAGLLHNRLLNSQHVKSLI